MTSESIENGERPMSSAPEGEGGRDPGDARADDQDVHVFDAASRFMVVHPSALLGPIV